MLITDFVKNIEVPVLILDSQGSFVMQNSRFKQMFGENLLPRKMQKFKNSFSIQSCMLYPENIINYNPIDLGLETIYPFKTIALYQRSADDYLTFLISSVRYESYYIFQFIDCSNDYKLSDITQKCDSIQKELEVLKEENEQYLHTKDKAQVQAIKMALLNRIFESLRQSIDLDVTLKIAFKELADIFGLSKVAFAFNDDGIFTIKNVFPQKYDAEINQTVSIAEKSLGQLNLNKFIIENVASKSSNQKILTKTECRILMPIYHTNKLLGLIIGIFPRKNLNKISDDMINAISAQFTSAIVQSYLFMEVNSKNEQLQKAFTKLEETQLQLINSEKMASLGQLVAGVAHEINTPLASINSNNSLFEKLLSMGTLDDDIIETAKSMISTDKEAIKRINNIVKSLKRFVRLDEAELQNADINKDLDSTLELLKHETKNRIEIVKNYGEIGEIKCYPNLLNQVFMNLLMNAIQSIESTGEIIITTQKNNQNLLISIKDNGVGMDEATKNKIFKTGFTTKKIGIGTGLGLMISKDIIEKHSGTISFNSQKGVGTEFVISIPVLQ